MAEVKTDVGAIAGAVDSIGRMAIEVLSRLHNIPQQKKKILLGLLDKIRKREQVLQDYLKSDKDLYGNVILRLNEEVRNAHAEAADFLKVWVEELKK